MFDTGISVPSIRPGGAPSGHVDHDNPFAVELFPPALAIRAVRTLPDQVRNQGRCCAMDITKDIQSMTSFRNRSAEVMQHLRETGRPVVLTVNGRAAAVIQDAEAYQKLLDVASDASAADGIRQGLADLVAGRTRPARDVFAELRAEYDLPR
jgi:prevent-host-death family protein